ncbi:FtsK/SpoIIIE family DNA translocase [Lactimicrobium massiliense]|uniref:FtsK/SpoIIIE family DNA translocase n=1 Tax=Lactimicrobium massiliense TaxID=2161814 RepID=UPI001FD994A0|nr:DNA translocase FtsK [Lactimicrobium massiliense]
MTQKKKKNTRKSKARIRQEQQEELRQWIMVVLTAALLLIGLMRTGTVGIFLYNLLRYVLGEWFWLILAVTVLWFLIAIASGKQDADDEKNPLPMILVILDLLLLCGYYTAGPSVVGFSALKPLLTNIKSYFQTAVTVSPGGGICGNGLYALVSILFGRSGTVVIMIAIALIATVLMGFMDAYKNAFQYVVDFFRAPEKEEPEEKEEVEDKEHPNLWKMVSEHQQKKAHFINADEAVDDVPLQDVQKKLEEGEEVVVRFKPTKISHSGLSGIDIRVDDDQDDTDNIELLSDTEPALEDTLKMQQPLSQEKDIFMNVDDLADHTEAKEYSEPEPQPMEPAEPEPEPVRQTEVQEGKAEEEPVPVNLPEREGETAPASDAKHGTVDYRNYRLPSMNKVLDTLPAHSSNDENLAAAKRKGQQLIQALETFDINARLKDMHIGPSVTQFEVQPDANVKVSRILGLTDNIKMQLEARDIRIEAPIPGRNAVGIEIPNEKSTPVKLRELVNSIPAKDKDQPLVFFLGKDLLGQTITCRIDKMPHLLIAGATGSGKSVCMNSIICSLLLRTRPDEVKMLLIDPKKVEFTPYRNIPHLIGPVINDPAQASNALKVIVRIMDERYNIFAANAVRNIAGYHALLKSKPAAEQARMDKMPYIVVIIDELADLMLVAGKDVEASIQRITQLARAAGIHLIVATQRPSADVITGIIKANIPSRIAFSVSSSIDSRVILDHTGAERLLGNGDMLYMPIGQNSATRIQGVFVTDEEVQRICDALSPWAPLYDDSFIMLEGVNDQEGGAVAGISDDPLYQEIKDYVIDVQKASTSLLQRRFGIGYNRAARMIDELESTGIIGPAQGSKPREVYVKKDRPKDDE